MDKLKKYLVAVAVVVVVLMLSGSYKSTELTNRAIVLGVGIDYETDTDEFLVTTEAYHATNTGGISSVSPKIIKGRGDTLDTAVQNIFGSIGKLPSMGQIGIMVVGESMFEQDLSQVLMYFLQSPAFRDLVTVVTCEGRAEDLFETTAPLDNMISFALSAVLRGAGVQANLQHNNLHSFLEKQTYEGGCSFLNRVEIIERNISDVNQGKEDTKPQVEYNCEKQDLFVGGKYQTTLDKQQSGGFNLLTPKNIFTTFVARDITQPSGKTDAKEKQQKVGDVSVGIKSKNVSRDISFGDTVKVTYTVKLELRGLRTDLSGEILRFENKKTQQENITQAVRDDVKRQAEDSANGVILKLQEEGCDLLGIGEQLFRDHGRKFEQFQKAQPDFLKNTTFEVVVMVK